MKKKQIKRPKKISDYGIDLKGLPKFICYKAALLREKMALKTLIAILSMLFCIHYAVTRLEIASLHKALREKEYILAPGVLDFTTVSPQAVPESYINDAVSDFLSDLGNVSASNIDEQYNSLKRFMSDELKITFDMEMSDWVEQIKREGIAQILSVTDKEITTDDNGNYRVIASVSVSYYAAKHYLGDEKQVIEMTLKLIPPQKSKRWYLQITSLTWSKADTFKIKNNLQQQRSQR